MKASNVMDVATQLSDSLDLREVVERMPAPVVCALLDDSVVFVNRAWHEYTGQSPQHLIGSLWQMTIHPDDLAKLADEWGTAFSAGRAFETETRLRRVDGHYHWFLVKKALAVLRNRDSKPSLHALIAFEDIDEQKKSEEERERLRRELAHLVRLDRINRVAEPTASFVQEIKHSIGAVVTDAEAFDQIIGESPALKTALSLVSVVAPTDSSVLILGETGTGKELVARAIHKLSNRSEKAFVKVNCAAIPLGLLESDLFGHEKGAFTGAIAQKTGRFELADKGTLFLDEVGDIPLELQAKLLRVLQEQEFERLGSNRTHKVDVRLIAATHRDLAAMVKQGTFREDLFYRLKVFPIYVPALRKRTEDIPRLVRHFTTLYAQRMNKRIDVIPPETMDALVRYQWPGNVRELQNFIERAVILSPHLVLRAPTSELEGMQPLTEPYVPLHRLAEVERDHIVRALEASNWVIGGRSGAAARLGMKRTSLVYRMKKLRIGRPAAVPQKRSTGQAGDD
jgi:PAS domain S-box-containing protein